MSRIIVKNLPKGMKEERLKSLFEERGQITDCSLKYTKDKVFRKFAFIGYKSCEDAEAAVRHFNKTFIDTSRIEVEIAKNLGDTALPRAWSKYTEGSSAFKQKNESNEPQPGPTKLSTGTQKGKSVDLFGDLQGNEKFNEFLEVHKSRATKTVWNNDLSTGSHGNPEKDRTHLNSYPVEKDDSSESDFSEEDNEEEATAPEPVGGRTLSDLEYLKSKIVKSHLLSDDSSDSDSSESDDTDREGSDTESDAGQSEEEKIEAQQKFIEEQAKYKYTIKMRGVPLYVTKTQIEKFFKPMIPTSVKIPQHAKSAKKTHTAVVQFSKEIDLEQAMRRNKNFIGQNKIFLYKNKEKLSEELEGVRPWEMKTETASEEVEGIEDSGRLYVRNLSYCAEESELEELFGKFGPLTEVHLPLDSFTKKPKGFAFMTYMMPEHAVKAYTELDGTTFQGRILHILPGKAKKDPETEITDSMSFKQKKDLKQKQQASNSHNWNTLFLGANAVADVMAEKYATSKDHILTSADRQSLGVRMALGETQLVAETRDFLTQHGIILDAFSQSSDKQCRSKCVILVKNLPANTKADELQQLFARHGTLGRLVLPPSGITAVVEFVHPSEARTAFRSLAYTKFKHLPLYLEWAPGGVFKSPHPSAKEPQAVKSAQEDDKEQPHSGTANSGTCTDAPVTPIEVDMPSNTDTKLAESGASLFVKNLNFDTTEEALSLHFQKFGVIHNVTIAKKKDLRNIGQMLSMGYGFVEYMKKKSADKALRQLQHSVLDDHKLELKISTRAVTQPAPVASKAGSDKPQPKTKTSKILVRNIPFEAKQHEVKELFSVFGELKFVRMPKKMTGSGSHRGFGFVDFISLEDAKRAFDALCHSTHLYGRRLVLEWAETEESVDQLRQKTAQQFHNEPMKKKFKKSNLMNELNKTSPMEL